MMRAEIHQTLLTHFSLKAEFLIGKVLVKDRDSRVLMLVNLDLIPEVEFLVGSDPLRSEFSSDLAVSWK